MIAHNFGIRIRNERVDEQTRLTAIARIRQREFWEDERFWNAVIASLPGYRFSTFQPLMPA